MLLPKLPTTISDYIFTDLRENIIDGTLKPNQTLREEEISIRFGSSRGPIRESLRLLLQTGLVVHQPRKGFKVRDYTPKQIRQIYTLRANLEGLVIIEFEGKDLNSLIATLKESNQRMEASFQKNDIYKYFQENIFFHQMIIDFADNDILKKTIALVNEVSLPVRYQLMHHSLPSRRSLTYHEQIVSFIEQGNLSEARILTEKHVLENIEKASHVYT
jgi:DNA-binding GntR family transcriptional regulator